MARSAGDAAIVVEGLRELQVALRRASADLPRELRIVNKAAAETVAAAAKDRSPVRTGRLRDSIAARAEQRSASVKGGGARVPYFGFIDFGGHVGRNNSVERPFIQQGRIIYPALVAKRDEVQAEYADGIDDLLRRAGLR